MSTITPSLIAETLELIDENRVMPRTIDAAQEAGRIAPGDVVMTSAGNATRAIITPYYPAFQFENNLLQRLDWAATYERPFAEAAIRFSAGVLNLAHVTVRYCERPTVEGTNDVLEAAACYYLDPTNSYGTLESVIEDLYKNYSTGIVQKNRTGTVTVPKIENRSEKHKWSVSPADDDEAVALAIKVGVSGTNFKRSFL